MGHDFGIVEVGGVVLRMCSGCGLTHILRAESAVWKEVINNEIPPCVRPDDVVEMKERKVGFHHSRDLADEVVGYTTTRAAINQR